MDRPTDRLTQSYIDAVINGLTAVGHQTAARALLELDVPLETALRVVTRPDERRRAKVSQAGVSER